MSLCDDCKDLKSKKDDMDKFCDKCGERHKSRFDDIVQGMLEQMHKDDLIYLEAGPEHDSIKEVICKALERVECKGDRKYKGAQK